MLIRLAAEILIQDLSKKRFIRRHRCKEGNARVQLEVIGSAEYFCCRVALNREECFAASPQALSKNRMRQVGQCLGNTPDCEML